ncbi:hypothetical protein PHYPSEUDO_012852 [Phytophthora pseudosyringae]|uniref:Auto-transporter adhesin head GIN domain-containing protein n=1 Tax=Phytophthora pseudosyringae TaxID=221518 RepID=A0A8T1V9F1_9STRA|nr:hypothetical protein PHYPSEUDO_012852 [Phytophthora pseudosyringae]
MKLSSFHALLVAAASLAAHAAADFKVTPEPIVKAATSRHVKYVKQWTLSAGAKTNSIDSIDLSLAGNAYVSYVSDLPTGVLGYVNVSGDSRTVVNAVTVSKDVDSDLDSESDSDSDFDDLLENDTNNGGELNVWLGDKAASGYLLTEIFLAEPEAVMDVKSQRSAQVVIEDGVLVNTGKRAELQIDATGSTAVYVSAPDADASVGQLSLETTGTASIEYNVNSLSVRSDLQMDAQGSSSITVLSSTLKTSQLDLSAVRKASICISAQEVKTVRRAIEGKNKISLPNSTKKHGTTGASTCEESTLPARKAAKITGASGMSTGSGDDLGIDLGIDLTASNLF